MQGSHYHQACLTVPATFIPSRGGGGGRDASKPRQNGKKPTFHLLIFEPAQGLVSSQDFFCKNVALLSQKLDFLGMPQGEVDGLV